jgi:uncharacterized protein YbcC (UPF0753/DUF2309 family)
MELSSQLKHVIDHMNHYLPSQAPLKDFIHHNTLHAFQQEEFHQGLQKASELFGYKNYLQLEEYRLLLKQGKIDEELLDLKLKEFIDIEHQAHYRMMLKSGPTKSKSPKKIGQIRKNWKKQYNIDMDDAVHPILFRLLSSYLDQGVSTWHFPAGKKGFIESLRYLEKTSFTSLFRSDRVRNFFQQDSLNLDEILHILLGSKDLVENYIYDQQFAHPGWSGMVSFLEENNDALIIKRPIKLKELILLECLLEIDVLDQRFGSKWNPINAFFNEEPLDYFSKTSLNEDALLNKIWQEAYEWTFYNKVLKAIVRNKPQATKSQKSFQAFFCMDDRECSFRRHLEKQVPSCETFGTPGHFNLDIYFQPEGGKFVTKTCPLPVNPSVVILELEKTEKLKKDFHFTERNQSFIGNLFHTSVLGWSSAISMISSIVRPKMTHLTNSANKHMDKNSKLVFQYEGTKARNGLPIGYKIEQMADRLEGLLKSTGLVKNFADIVYFIGHGSTSVNNTHYAGYDCGACSGRPGSVNARVIAAIGNNQDVRKILSTRGVEIPDKTTFVGALHDTSRDEIQFYDLGLLSEEILQKHKLNDSHFKQALLKNSVERSRKFSTINSSLSDKKVDEKVKRRSLSIFEPRPELNHATNTLCIVGRRDLSRNIFLDRRSFMNSYNYEVDPEGKYLEGILNAVAPVAGGINLEYYFSRVDNQNLGAGSKLPHNVVGLIGVANGIEGDLRTGLPSQMIELHEPMRLMVIVEHFPEFVLKAIQKNKSTYNWFDQNWIHLVVLHPTEKQFYLFKNGAFTAYNGFKSSESKPVNIIEELLSEASIDPFLIQNN